VAPAVLQEERDRRPADLDELFADLAAVPGLEVRFEEEKHLALLAVPLKSEGRLYFLRPGHLARIVARPIASRVLITPDRLVTRDQDGEKVIDLGQNQALRAFVTSLLQVFAGDRKTLARSYHVTYAVDPDAPLAWSLVLAPKQEPLTRMLRSLALFGEGRAIRRIEVVEHNGDRSVTRILAADPRRQFTDQEKRELFGIEPG
jgi:hypothetical protein